MRWVVLLSIVAGCGRLGFDAALAGRDAAPLTGDVARDAPADAMAGGDAMLDSGAGPVALIQSTSAITSTGPQAVLLPGGTTSGTLLVATIAVNSVSGLALPPGWTMATMGSEPGACTSIIATEISGSAGRQSFTFSFPAGAPVAIQVSEWAGVDLTALFDASGAGGSGTPTTALAISTAAAASAPGELAISSFCEDTTTPAFTAGAGWTELGQAATTAASPSIFSERLQNAPATQITATATSSLSTKYAGTIVTFRAL